MCSGRVDLSFVIRAFASGMDGVFIGGCHLGECHYLTDGNYHALGMVLLAGKIMERIGIDPGRIRIEGVSAGEGIRFAEIMNDFARTLGRMGPIGDGEGAEARARGRKLAALEKLVPYIRLVARERLRPPARTEEAYRALYASGETDRLIGETIGDRITAGEMVSLLSDGPLTTGEMAEKLGLSPSEVSRHLKGSSRQGIVRYDPGLGRYSLA